MAAAAPWRAKSQKDRFDREMGYSQVIHRLMVIVSASGGESKNQATEAQEKRPESGGNIFKKGDDFL